MAISLKHTTQSTGGPYTPTGELGPDEWNEEHTLTMATARLLGRTTASTGVAEEISVASPLTLSGGSLGASVAQANVTGLTTADSPQFAGINVGNASDTTITRASAGVIAVEGSNVLMVSNLGVSVQAYDAELAAIAALSVTDSNFIVGNGTTWVAESGATARTSMGVGTGDSPQFTGVNIGHATDTTITRASAGVIAVEGNNVLMANNIGVTVQAYDADTAKLDVEDQVLTGGARVTVKDLGNTTGVTITPDPGDRAIQKVTNNGAWTLAPGSNNGCYLLSVINTTGAAVPTTSGFTKVDGSFDNTTTSKFHCAITVTADYSVLQILKIV